MLDNKACWGVPYRLGNKKSTYVNQVKLCRVIERLNKYLGFWTILNPSKKHIKLIKFLNFALVL